MEVELRRFRDAVGVVVGKISETAEGLRGSGNEDEAGIFDFHAEMAEDPELASAVDQRVKNLQSPEAAVLAAGEEYAAEFEAMEDEYLSARADDVRDVTRQISAELMGQAELRIRSPAQALHLAGEEPRAFRHRAHPAKAWR